MDGVCTTQGLLVSESAVLCGIGELLGGASEFSKAGGANSSSSDTFSGRIDRLFSDANTAYSIGAGTVVVVIKVEGLSGALF